MSISNNALYAGIAVMLGLGFGLQSMGHKSEGAHDKAEAKHEQKEDKSAEAKSAVENELKGCAPSGDAKEISALFDQWNASLATGKAEEVAKNYAPDGILLPTVSNKVRHTSAEIADYFVHFLQKKPKGTILECNIRKYGDIAINSGVYRFDIEADGKPKQVQARYTYVYKKQADGKWLIAEHHSSGMPEKAEPKKEEKH